MNPGVQALDRRPAPDGKSVQYWPCGRPTQREWVNAAGLVHRAASFSGTRGLSVTAGRSSSDVMYRYDAKEDA